MIEIGIVDILNEVSMLSSHQSAPREVHLQKTLHIFTFLKKNPKLTLYFDPNLAITYPTSFKVSSAKKNRDQYIGKNRICPMMHQNQGEISSSCRFC